jgi:hypothetical protein
MALPVVLAPLLASLALAGAEPVCHGQHAPLTKEQQRQATLGDYAEQRASFGFRSDIPYIEELIRRGVWEYDVGYIPVTPAENRYLRLHDRLELGARAHRYLRERRDLSGGVSIEEGWPGEPYLLVRLTRDRAHHEAELRRLARFPDNLRTVEVTYSERRLNRLAHRIGRDRRELKAAGFDLSFWGADVQTNTAEVGMITRRTDHAEYFAQRYGPVTTVVIATEPTSLECARAGNYEISGTGRSLVLHWGTGGGAELEHVELVEHADRVEVGIVERVPNGPRTLELRSAAHRVPLSAPLGDRAVIDAAIGLRLRQRGPSPGEPPCPRMRPMTALDYEIDQRRRNGLPHGRAYVRRLIRRPVPFTDAEQRYLDRRDALRGERVDGYLERHRDEFGGADVRGRFPGEPVLVVRFTRRLALHRRNLERLVDGRFRVVSSPYTEAELRAIESRVEEASEGFIGGWGDDGVLVRNTHIEAGRVIVQVVSARDDYAAVLRERFGPAVKAVRVGTRHECLPPLL